MQAPESQLFVECDMDEPRLLPFVRGTVAVYTRRCPGRETPNEDCAAGIIADPTSGILVVADGVGGAPAGQQASAVAVQTLQDAIDRFEDDRHDLRPAVLDGIERANRTILELGVGAATTLAVVEVHEHGIRPYHVGDSMILLVGQRGRIKWQTIPHSPVGHAIESGLIDEDEAMNHDDRHVVSNIVGSEEMRIEIGPTLRMSPRDTLLIASDGLSDNLSLDEIVNLARTGPMESRMERLAKQAHARMDPSTNGSEFHGKPDDLTFIAMLGR